MKNETIKYLPDIKFQKYNFVFVNYFKAPTLALP